MMTHDMRAILEAALAAEASDLHLCTGERPIVRIDGKLRRLDQPTLTADNVRSAIDELGADSSALDERCEAEFAAAWSDRRLRVSAYRTLRGPALAARVVPLAPPDLDDIPAPDAVQQLIDHEKGLVLVTGPTGSGKSTTLASLVHRLNQDYAKHVVTIEDPIEYVHANQRGMVNQREIGRHATTFAQALRSALREDPDVLLIGEMRDLETVSLALTAAETGQLVLATLHAPSAAQAVDRIVDVFPTGEKELVRGMLGVALVGVVAQRLLPRRDGGRAAALEVMLGTTAVRNQIREGKIAQLPQTVELGRRSGMRSMNQAIDELVEAGLIDRVVGEEAKAYEGDRGSDDGIAGQSGRRATTASDRQF